jgi:hypothetical protein
MVYSLLLGGMCHSRYDFYGGARPLIIDKSDELTLVMFLLIPTDGLHRNDRSCV